MACTDNIAIDTSATENERFSGEKVMLAAGTTENSVSTRADGKTYYMPADHRFVCKMYYKTDESGADYDTIRAHTAWLKVDNEGAGNSLYWKSSYPPTAQHLDNYNNDEFAPTFYWQNRREHAFLAWTDLNHATSVTGNNIHFEEKAPFAFYPHHTGVKEWQWEPKYLMVHNLLVPFNSLGDLRDAAINPHGNALEALATDDAQAEQNAFATTLGELQRTDTWVMFQQDIPYIFCTIDRPNLYWSDSSYEMIDDTHRKSQWYKMSIYDFDSKEEYTENTSNQRVYAYGTYVVDDDGKFVALQDPANPGTFYKCDKYGYVVCNDVKYVFFYQEYETHENNEIIEDYPAMAFDLRSDGKSSMAEQPDILQALTIDQVPTSAIMEANRVHLRFKHQFAQVQVNLKNSVDNSVMIEPEQIRNVELLGVTNTGYMFTSLKADGTISTPLSGKSSHFKEVVATDFTDEQLQDNPYGTIFNMFERALSDDDINLSKIIKSYEGITFGRLQAIRITWQEKVDDGGVEHVTTYRVPEKSELGQSLRLLEAGKKYIWNMELRRGTLAVIRTEIIPWEENQEEYNLDGFIVASPAASSNKNSNGQD